MQGGEIESCSEEGDLYFSLVIWAPYRADVEEFMGKQRGRKNIADLRGEGSVGSSDRRIGFHHPQEIRPQPAMIGRRSNGAGGKKRGSLPAEKKPGSCQSERARRPAAEEEQEGSSLVNLEVNDLPNPAESSHSGQLPDLYYLPP